MILKSRLTLLSRPKRRSSLLGLPLALLTVLGATQQTPVQAQTIISSSATRTAIPRVDTAANNYQALYDYCPTAMTEGSTHRVWWGGAGNRGTPDYTDCIFYATNTGDFYSGAWTAPRIMLRPSFVSGTFDRTHVCDPCVIKEGSTYYMYYGGLNDKEGSFQTAIGYATSTDRSHWTRQNGGKHIIQWKSPVSYGSAYGAGQPSVVKQGSWFYMIYTTVSRPSSGAAPVGGEFAIRSLSPNFVNVQERRKNSSGVTTWVDISRSGTGPLPLVRDSPLFGGDHVYDLTFLNQRNAFMAYSASGKVYFLDGNLNQVFPNVLNISSPGFREQRTVRRNANGTVDENSNKRYDLNFMAAKFTGPAGTEGNIFYYDLGTQNVSISVP